MNHVLGTTPIPILLIIGCALLAGTVGAWVFQRLHIPQVVGYIVSGVLVGKSGLGLINDDRIQSLMPVSFLALGVIGFVVGGGLHRDAFRKHGKQFFAILFAEGMGAFFLVSLAVGAITYALTRSVAVSVAFGMTLGAISSATDPAATVDVLWEYKTRGILTTTTFAIVAMDDALALVLYSIATGLATCLIGMGTVGIGWNLAYAGYQLGGAVALGAVAGALLNQLLRRTREPERSLTFVLGILTVVLGLTMLLKVDLILAAMSLGITVVNIAPHHSEDAIKTLKRFAQPIYILFFVIVGARLSIGAMPGWMWGIVLAYVIGRTAGKMMGARLGARWSGASQNVRKYLGLCLFGQAGVAIGLAIVASIKFSHLTIGGTIMGDAIIMIATATTLIVQLIGPPCVKVAVTKAGEVGLNVTEESLIESYTAGDAMDASAPTFHPDATVASILKVISKTDAMSFPVVNEKKQIIGMITMEALKHCLGASQNVEEWLVAFDVMAPAPEPVHKSTPLPDAIAHMKSQSRDSLPVVSEGDSAQYLGLLELRAVNRMISREVLRRLKLADT
ncbi:MAG: CBS domain-containing protein [Planctomycetes bacterium]|nr:CBS domain-containing protein [Planctomycetota bacterium]